MKLGKNQPFKMHIFVEIRYMDHGLNIEENQAIKILRPGSWSQVTWYQDPDLIGKRLR